MMFRVGQKIECISVGWGCKNLQVGRVYTVAKYSGHVPALKPDKNGSQAGIELVECRDGTHPMYWASRFRPLVDTKSEVSFTTGADPSTDQFDNRRKVRKKVAT